MEVLSMFGTTEQKEKWLKPLLDGTIRSSFAMTEPGVASSDATNIETSIVRDGDDYVLNGRKWWITGAMNPNAKIFIAMGKTDPSAERHRQQSMILVERDTPGFEILRGMHVFGYHDRDHGGHAELVFNVVEDEFGMATMVTVVVAEDMHAAQDLKTWRIPLDEDHALLPVPLR